MDIVTNVSFRLDTLWRASQLWGLCWEISGQFNITFYLYTCLSTLNDLWWIKRMFREGVTAVEEPENCPNVSRISCKYALIFQEFLQLSSLPIWNRFKNIGFWRQLTVRLNWGILFYLGNVISASDNHPVYSCWQFCSVNHGRFEKDGLQGSWLILIILMQASVRSCSLSRLMSVLINCISKSFPLPPVCH